MSKGNTICWTDIPVNNVDRAIQFYSAVLGTPVTKQSMPGMEFGLLPHADENVSGCLVKTEDNQPSEHGPLVYLSVEGRLDDAIRAAEKGGGKILKDFHKGVLRIKKRYPREEDTVCPTVGLLKNQATVASLRRPATNPRAVIAVPNRTKVFPPSGTWFGPVNAFHSSNPA